MNADWKRSAFIGALRFDYPQRVIHGNIMDRLDSLMHKLRLTLLLCSASALLAAPPYDASWFSGLQWRSIGPNRGGRSITSAGSPGRPFEYYFGAGGGG